MKELYKESNYSKNLMKMNAYYRDNRYGNPKYMRLFHIKERLLEFKNLLIDIIKVRNQGGEKVWLKISSFFNPMVVRDHRLAYSFDHNYEIEYEATGKIVNGKIAVYTSIFGNYDPIVEPLYKSDKCDYYAITDLDIPENSAWKKMDVIFIKGFDDMDSYHKSKFCKMMPHLLFPEYEYSIWVDGNVQIVADMYPLVDRLDEQHTMGMFQNPLHDCIYTEAKYNICQNNVKVQQIQNQINIYKAEGFPQMFGLREFSIIARRHNDEECVRMMNDWWEQVNTYTMRDQLSFPYVLWKYGKTMDYVQLLGGNWRWNPRFICYPHNWHITFKR